MESLRIDVVNVSGRSDHISFPLSQTLKLKFKIKLAYGSEVLKKESANTRMLIEFWEREENLCPMNSMKRTHSPRICQQGINEPQNIKSSTEQSLLMSWRLVFTPNYLVGEDLSGVLVTNSSSKNHSRCCQRVTPFNMSGPCHLKNQVQTGSGIQGHP